MTDSGKLCPRLQTSVGVKGNPRPRPLEYTEGPGAREWEVERTQHQSVAAWWHPLLENNRQVRKRRLYRNQRRELGGWCCHGDFVNFVGAMYVCPHCLSPPLVTMTESLCPGVCSGILGSCECWVRACWWTGSVRVLVLRSYSTGRAQSVPSGRIRERENRDCSTRIRALSTLIPLALTWGIYQEQCSELPQSFGKEHAMKGWTPRYSDK